MNKQFDFLCFLAKQATRNLRDIVEEKAFQLLYPMEIKAKELRDIVEAQAFAFIYPFEQKQRKLCEQIAYETFKVLYPIEKTYNLLKDKEKVSNVLQEQTFLVLYPVEKCIVNWKEHTDTQVLKTKLEANYHQYKQAWIKHLRWQTQKMQATMYHIKKKIVRFHTLKTPIQCNTIQLYLQKAQVKYLHTLRFKSIHRKLERMHEGVLVVIRKSYNAVENRIVANFTMLFGIISRWARGSTLIGYKGL